MIRTFLLRLMYFVIPLTAIGFVGDKAVSELLGQSKTYASGEYSTWNDLYGGVINSDIAIYGSSRAVVQIDPQIVEDSLQRPTYNLGVDGHNFWLQYFRHNELLRYNKKPKAILHSLDVTTLTAKGELFNADQFLPYMLWDKSIQSELLPYAFFSKWDFNCPLVRYFGKVTALSHAAKLLFIKQPDSVGRTKGYQSQRLGWNTDLDKARSKVSSIRIEIDSSALRLFEQYLADCNEQGIRVILIYTPQYIEGQQFIENKESILRIYQTLANKYRLPFLDYSTDTICYSKDYFYNSGHLNKDGSAKFTRQLCRDLGKVLVIN